jgi:hypothetical protein
MTLLTSSIEVVPSQGWTWFVTNPVTLIIRNRDYKPFQIAVLSSPGTPTDTGALVFSSYSQDDGHFLELDPAPAGVYYVRALLDGPMGETTKFGYLADDGIILSVTVDSTAITVDNTIITCDAT